MDSELAKLVQQAVRSELTTASGLVFATSLLGAGIGAFVAAYLKKKAELRATNENFETVRRQQEVLIRATEAIRGEISGEVAKALESFKARLQEDVYFKTEVRQSESVFLRELYVDALKAYSTKQARALRQAYLLLFEPGSSTVGGAETTLDERVALARTLVMAPLRKYLGLLDEETERKIYAVQDALIQLSGLTPEEIRERKQHLFNTTDVARQFIKADRIAFRLGLIRRPLGKGERET